MQKGQSNFGIYSGQIRNNKEQMWLSLKNCRAPIDADKRLKKEQRDMNEEVRRGVALRHRQTTSKYQLL